MSSTKLNDVSVKLWIRKNYIFKNIQGRHCKMQPTWLSVGFDFAGTSQSSYNNKTNFGFFICAVSGSTCIGTGKNYLMMQVQN